METSQVSEYTDIYQKAKEESQNYRIRIDLKKHNWLAMKIKREKLWIKKSLKSSSIERSSAERAPKQRQTLPVSLPIALFHNVLDKLNRNMNNQPSLWGIKIIQKPPVSVYAKPFNRNTSTSNDHTESQPPLNEKNSIKVAEPVPPIIPLMQPDSKINNVLPINDHGDTITPVRKITLLRQVRGDGKKLTKEIIMAMKSRNNAVNVKRKVKPQKSNKKCQTDYEIFLSDEDTDLLYFLRNNFLNKAILMDLLDNFPLNENNNQPNISNNNVEVIDLEGDEANQPMEEIVIDCETFDSVQNILIKIKHMTEELKMKISMLTEKEKEDIKNGVTKIYCEFFDLELDKDLVKTAEKGNQTTNTMNRNPEYSNKRRYTATTQLNEHMNNIVALNNKWLFSPPPPPPAQPEEPQKLPVSLEQHNSMNQQVKKKTSKQNSNQNTSTYSSNIKRVPQQHWLRQAQPQRGYYWNDPRINRAVAPQEYQSGWYNGPEQPEHNEQYDENNDNEQPNNTPYGWYPPYEYDKFG